MITVNEINNLCAVCLSQAPLRPAGEFSGIVLFRSCPRCGNYEITTEAHNDIYHGLGSAESPLRLRASYWLNSHPGTRVMTTHVPTFEGLEEPSFQERVEATLDLVRQKTGGRIGKEIGVHVPRFCGASCSADDSELTELLEHLIDEKWLARGGKPQTIKLTGKGLQRLQQGDNVEKKASVTFKNNTFVNSPVAAGQDVEQTVGDITVSSNDREVLLQLVEAIQNADAPDHEKDDAILAVKKIEQAKDVAQVRRWYDHLKGIGSVVKAIPAPVWAAAGTVFEKLLLGG